MEIITIASGIAIKGEVIQASELPENFKTYIKSMGVDLGKSMILSQVVHIIAKKGIAEYGVVYQGSFYGGAKEGSGFQIDWET